MTCLPTHSQTHTYKNNTKMAGYISGIAKKQSNNKKLYISIIRFTFKAVKSISSNEQLTEGAS